MGPRLAPRGYSVNEINPKFALQNAPSNVYTGAGGTIAAGPYGGFPGYAAGSATTSYTQHDNVGVSVALTQLRNILAGTVPTDLANPYPVASLTATGAVDSTKLPVGIHNNDLNVVLVDGLPYLLPNGVADGDDYQLAANAAIDRSAISPVPGRWGEAQGIPQQLQFPSSTPIFSGLTYPTYWYTNPVRAGRSVYGTNSLNGSSATNDIMDDDLDATDPLLASIAADDYIYNPPAMPPYPTRTIARDQPEKIDFIDGAGQFGVASERLRRFVTPTDPAGTGRLVPFMTRPANSHDYGLGYDNSGRTSFFRYFRPAGMPQEVRYPFGGYNSVYPHPYSPYLSMTDTEARIRQQYLMPQFYPAGTVALGSTSDISNNRLHGYQSMLTPQLAPAATPAITAQVIASMGAMPYDWDSNANAGAGDVPVGYGVATPAPVQLHVPTINPFDTSDQVTALNNATILRTSINTSYGPNLGAIGNPTGGTYPIPYADYTANRPYSGTNAGIYYPGAQVVNGYLLGSLNKDEADEMNLYAPSRTRPIQPFGPSDLEWLYRKHDVDGATLTSRLSEAGPGQPPQPGRRPDPPPDCSPPIPGNSTRFAYANDNPHQYAAVPRTIEPVSCPTPAPCLENIRTRSSTFGQLVRVHEREQPGLELPNLVPFLDTSNTSLRQPRWRPSSSPTRRLPPQSSGRATTSATSYQNSAYIQRARRPRLTILPHDPDRRPSKTSLFDQRLRSTAQVDPSTNGVVVPFGRDHQRGRPSIPSPRSRSRPLRSPIGDRKINLNFPLPIANDPAEPVRQKWCRETYQTPQGDPPPRLGRHPRGTRRPQPVRRQHHRLPRHRLHGDPVRQHRPRSQRRLATLALDPTDPGQSAEVDDHRPGVGQPRRPASSSRPPTSLRGTSPTIPGSTALTP